MKGSLVAIVTPMHDDGAVDYESFKKLIQFHEEQGTDGIVLVGTTGESATLSSIERGKIFSFARNATSLPLMAGVGSSSTKDATSLIDIALKNGIDDCLAVTPYYNRPSQKGLFLHYKELAKTGAQIFLYNVPGRTGVDLLPSTVNQLMDIENIVGLKEAVATNERFDELYLKGIKTKNSNEAERFALFAEAEKIMMEQAPVIILWYQENFTLYQSDIRNFHYNYLLK